MCLVYQMLISTGNHCKSCMYCEISSTFPWTIDIGYRSLTKDFIIEFSSMFIFMDLIFGWLVVKILILIETNFGAFVIFMIIHLHMHLGHGMVLALMGLTHEEIVERFSSKVLCWGDSNVLNMRCDSRNMFEEFDPIMIGLEYVNWCLAFGQRWRTRS